MKTPIYYVPLLAGLAHEHMACRLGPKTKHQIQVIQQTLSLYLSLYNFILSLLLYLQCVCSCNFTVFTDGTEDYDSEGSDSEEDGDFEGAANGIYDEDSDDDEESDDSDEADGFTHRSSVIIEEVHDVEHDGIHITSATAAKVIFPA